MNQKFLERGGEVKKKSDLLVSVREVTLPRGRSKGEEVRNLVLKRVGRRKVNQGLRVKGNKKEKNWERRKNMPQKGGGEAWALQKKSTLILGGALNPAKGQPKEPPSWEGEKRMEERGKGKKKKKPWATRGSFLGGRKEKIQKTPCLPKASKVHSPEVSSALLPTR